MDDDSATTKSRTSSTYAAAAVRPRAKRFITGFEGFSEEAIGGENGGGGGSLNPSTTPAAAAGGDDVPLSFPRHASPIPSKHPSRSSSIQPGRTRGLSEQDSTNDLAASLSGLWGKSWTSLQGLASNVLGSDLTSELGIGSHGSSRRPSPASSRPGTSSRQKQWGPTPPVLQLQPGAGSKGERGAAVRARKRNELMAASGPSYKQNNGYLHKRRNSDDFGSSSAPPADTDNRDILIYVHHVRPQDTLAGISIRYNCQMATVKKVNRMWSNDGVQARKTLMIPVDSCTIRGRKVVGPEHAEAGPNSVDEEGQRRLSVEPGSWGGRRDSSSTVTPESSAAAMNESASDADFETQRTLDEPWTHDSWTILEGQTEATEIARVPRQNFGFFPRARRRSGSFSSADRSSISLDMPRPSITISDTSSGRQSMHRPRRSSGSNPFVAQLNGPGGVGSLKGRGPSMPGPAEDKLTKVFTKQIPGMIKINGVNGVDEDGHPTAATTPNFSELSNAVEVWAKKLSKGLAKALEPPGTTGGRRQQGAPGYDSTTSGDLIELENAFDIGEDGDEAEDNLITPTNGPATARGRNDGLLGDAFTNGATPRASHTVDTRRLRGLDGGRRKGD